VVANEFGEAQGLHRSALFAAGLVLFVLTLFVNGAARLYVIRSSRGTKIKERRAEDEGPAQSGAAAAVGA